MVDFKNDRDKELQELDELMSPLSKVQPSADQTAQWKAALMREMLQNENKQSAVPKSIVRRPLGRIGEWAVAAAAGFLLAIALEHFVDSGDQAAWTYSGVDATQMRFVANQD